MCELTTVVRKPFTPRSQNSGDIKNLTSCYSGCALIFFLGAKRFLEKDAYAIANKNEFRLAKSKWTLLGKRAFNDEILNIEKLNKE